VQARPWRVLAAVEAAYLIPPTHSWSSCPVGRASTGHPHSLGPVATMLSASRWHQRGARQIRLPAKPSRMTGDGRRGGRQRNGHFYGDVGERWLRLGVRPPPCDRVPSVEFQPGRGGCPVQCAIPAGSLPLGRTVIAGQLHHGRVNGLRSARPPGACRSARAPSVPLLTDAAGPGPDWPPQPLCFP